jgi:hypothetical protein
VELLLHFDHYAEHRLVRWGLNLRQKIASKSKQSMKRLTFGLKSSFNPYNVHDGDKKNRVDEDGLHCLSVECTVEANESVLRCFCI